MHQNSVRSRLEQSLNSTKTALPVYAVYDWFVINRPEVNWDTLFSMGLGEIRHANIIRLEHPNYTVHEEITTDGEYTRRDVHILTDRGELHEWYLNNWKQEYFIKCDEDYQIMARALEGVSVSLDETEYLQSESLLGERGVTLATLRGLGNGRTPLMILQIDWLGLERWSYDLALENRGMADLLEIMNDITIQEFRCAAQSSAVHIKLWENLSIDTMGPKVYGEQLLPLYNEAISILDSASKKLHVHYDGRLKLIAGQIDELGVFGIDSFTEPPEGDMTIGEARALWPEKFLWVHPNLDWYEKSDTELRDKINYAVEAAGPDKFCLEISENVPESWERTVPVVLETLERLAE